MNFHEKVKGGPLQATRGGALEANNTEKDKIGHNSITVNASGPASASMGRRLIKDMIEQRRAEAEEAATEEANNASAGKTRTETRTTCRFSSRTLLHTVLTQNIFWRGGVRGHYFACGNLPEFSEDGHYD